jgi:thioredoxin reductase
MRGCGRLPERLALALTDNGLVAVGAFARASAPSVYAAGDVAVASQQVAVALGSGHLAGLSATRELLLRRAAQSQPDRGSRAGASPVSPALAC